MMEGEEIFKIYQKRSKIKILCVGEKKIGRTTILKSFCEGPSNAKIKKKPENSEGTFAAEIHTKINKLADIGIANIIEFMDIPGEKSLRGFINVYISQIEGGFDGLLYFFDIENIKTLTSFRDWMRALYSYTDKENGYLLNIPILMVGTYKTFTIKSHDEMEYRKEMIKQEIKGYFNCPPGKNLIFLPRESQSKCFDMKFLQSFIDELCRSKHRERAISTDLRSTDDLWYTHFDCQPTISENFKLSDKYVFSKFNLLGHQIDSNDVKAFMSYISQKGKEKIETFKSSTSFYYLIIELFSGKNTT